MSNAAPLILVADDESHILHVVTLKLRLAGYRTVTARDGREAHRLVAAGGVDAMITDYHMPHLSGLELCERLRQEGRSVPTILLTARGYDLTDADTARGGIRRLMTKPFSPRALIAAVADLLNEAKAA